MPLHTWMNFDKLHQRRNGRRGITAATTGHAWARLSTTRWMDECCTNVSTIVLVPIDFLDCLSDEPIEQRDMVSRDPMMFLFVDGIHDQVRVALTDPKSLVCGNILYETSLQSICDDILPNIWSPRDNQPQGDRINERSVEVDFHFVPHDDQPFQERVLNAVCGNQNLQRLILCGIRKEISAPFVASILRCPTITALTLKEVSTGGQDNKSGWIVKTARHQRVELHIDHNSVVWEGLYNHAVVSLTNIDHWTRQIQQMPPPLGLPALLYASMTEVAAFTFRDCFLDDVVWTQVRKALQSNPTFTDLTLTNCAMDATAMIDFASIGATVDNLTLDIAWQKRPFEGDTTCAEVIAKLLVSASPLKQLTISGLRQEKTHHVFTGVRMSKKRADIQIAALNLNSVFHIDAVSLAKCLRWSTKLRVLNLENVDRYVVGSDLVDAVRRNGSLFSVSFPIEVPCTHCSRMNCPRKRRLFTAVERQKIEAYCHRNQYAPLLLADSENRHLFPFLFAAVHPTLMSRNWMLLSLVKSIDVPGCYEEGHEEASSNILGLSHNLADLAPSSI